MGATIADLCYLPGEKSQKSVSAYLFWVSKAARQLRFSEVSNGSPLLLLRKGFS